MKCPFCGTKGARVNSSLFDPDAMIHTAIDCLNIECSCHRHPPRADRPGAAARRRPHPPTLAGGPVRFSQWFEKIHLPWPGR